ncbi:MAG: acetate--CoA ligase family protein [Acidimicrobiia bacterium]
MGDLARLLDPASVAFIGGERAAFAIEQSRLLGFDGPMWAVNPSRDALAGVPTVGSVADLPAVPDAAFVAVDRVRSIEVVAALRELGAGGAVCYASGYAESGPEGADLQARLVEAAGEMPIIGPNCHGYVNALSGAVLWPDVQGCRPVERGAAIVTQSGNLAINLTMQQRGLALSHVITLGNQAGIGIEDCVEFLVADDRVTAIGLHVEALSDPARFARVALRAHELRKPIVALKTGITDAGATIARTHTASLAGSGAAYRALFDRVGVVQVDSLPVLLATLAVLGAHGRLPGNRLTSLSCSGGEAGLIADRAAAFDVTFPAFGPEQAARIADTLSNRVPITNPLDYHTFIWGDRAAMTACFSAALSGGVDAGILVIDFPAPGADDTWWWPTLESFVEAHRVTGVAGVVTSTLPENLPVGVARWLTERGVPALPGIDDALAALAGASRPAPVDPTPPLASAIGTGVTGTLGEQQAKVLLSEAGVAVPPGLVAPRSGLAAAASAIGYPVVLKAIGLDHKTEAGGVAVGLGSDAELERAATSMAALGSSFLVERFESNAVAELVVAVRREPPLGWAVTIGSGGVLVELMADTVTLLAPVTADEVEAALRSLGVWPLLAGHRGRVGGDVAATVDAITRLVEMVVSDGSFLEFEVNPLLVLSDGAVAVDALAVIEL